MKNLFLIVALAFAFAFPFVGEADAYGQRWYMVKNNTKVFTQSGNDRQRGSVLCSVNKGDRLERISSGTANLRIKVRVVGDWLRAFCRGWVPIGDVYNMDTFISNLDAYQRIGNTVPVFKHSHDIWSSRNYARDRGYDPHRRAIVCRLTTSTKVHVSKDYFNGSAEIHVVDGPCKGKNGWILSYTINRNKFW